jgi:hypothetical protein
VYSIIFFTNLQKITNHAVSDQFNLKDRSKKQVGVKNLEKRIEILYLHTHKHKNKKTYEGLNGQQSFKVII